jgi:hypothetical protein
MIVFVCTGPCCALVEDPIPRDGKPKQRVCESAQKQRRFGYLWEGSTHRETTKTVIIAAIKDAQAQLVEQRSCVKVDSDLGME